MKVALEAAWGQHRKDLSNTNVMGSPNGQKKESSYATYEWSKFVE